jgi:hypothetical protein
LIGTFAGKPDHADAPCDDLPANAAEYLAEFCNELSEYKSTTYGEKSRDFAIGAFKKLQS